MFYQIDQRAKRSKQMNRTMPQKPKIQLPLSTVKQSQRQLKMNTNSSVQDTQQGALHLSKQSTILDGCHFELQNLVYQLKSTINDLCIKNEQLHSKEEQLGSNIRFLLKEKSTMIKQINSLNYQLQLQQEKLNRNKFFKHREQTRLKKTWSEQKSSNIPLINKIQKLNKINAVQDSISLQCGKHLDKINLLTQKVQELEMQNEKLKCTIQDTQTQKFMITRNFHNSKTNEIAEILIKSDEQKAAVKQEAQILRMNLNELKTQIQYLKQRERQMETRIQYYKNELKIKMSFVDQATLKQEESLSLGIRKRQEKIDELMSENNRLLNTVNSLQHKLALKNHHLKLQNQLNSELRKNIQQLENKYQRLNQNIDKQTKQLIKYQQTKEEKDSLLKIQIKQLRQRQTQLKSYLQQVQFQNVKLIKKVELLTISSDSQVLRRKLQTICKQMIINQTQLKSYRKQVQAKDNLLNQKQQEINRLNLRLERQRQSHQQKLRRTFVNFDIIHGPKSIVQAQKSLKTNSFQQQMKAQKSKNELMKLEKIKSQQLSKNFEKLKQKLIEQNNFLRNQNQELKETICSLRDKMEGNLRSIKQIEINQCVSRDKKLSRSRSFGFEDGDLPFQNSREISENRKNVQMLLRKTQPTFTSFKQLQKRTSEQKQQVNATSINQNLTETVKNKKNGVLVVANTQNPTMRIKELIQKVKRQIYITGKVNASPVNNQRKNDEFLRIDSHQEDFDRRLSSVMEKMHYSVNLGQEGEQNVIESQFPSILILKQGQEQNPELPNQRLDLLNHYSKKQSKSRHFSDQQDKIQPNFQQKQIRYQKKDSSKLEQISLKMNGKGTKRDYYECQTDRVLERQVKLQVQNLFACPQVTDNQSAKLKRVKSSDKIQYLKDFATQNLNFKSNPETILLFENEATRVKENDKKVNINELNQKIKRIRQSNRQLRKANLSGNLFYYKSPKNRNNIEYEQRKGQSNKTLEANQKNFQQSSTQEKESANVPIDSRNPNAKLNMNFKSNASVNTHVSDAQNFLKNLKKKQLRTEGI